MIELLLTTDANLSECMKTNEIILHLTSTSGNKQLIKMLPAVSEDMITMHFHCNSDEGVILHFGPTAAGTSFDSRLGQGRSLEVIRCGLVAKTARDDAYYHGTTVVLDANARFSLPQLISGENVALIIHPSSRDGFVMRELSFCAKRKYFHDDAIVHIITELYDKIKT